MNGVVIGFLVFLGVAVAGVVVATFASTLLGLVVISEREVGIVVKKFAAKSLPAGRLVALNGEAGYQADTLAPGWHFWYWFWQYNILKVPMLVIPQGDAARAAAVEDERALRLRYVAALRRRLVVAAVLSSLTIVLSMVLPMLSAELEAAPWRA